MIHKYVWLFCYVDRKFKEYNTQISLKQTLRILTFLEISDAVETMVEPHPLVIYSYTRPDLCENFVHESRCKNT